MHQYKRFLSLFLFILLLFPLSVKSEDIEEIEEWEELADESDTLLATDVFYHVPSEHSPVKCTHEQCFWNLEMGRLTDEAAIWEILTQPVTVIDGKQREQVRILARPEEKCKDYTGVVTCASQAVHILDRQGDWTLIEAYSSSEQGSAVPVFADQFQGWVKTSRLKEVEVAQDYGLVVDKLQQRLYVFKEGKLFSTLLCSTGFAKKSTPYHETPAGEYLIVSWVGDFPAETLLCEMGMRVNSGILIHQVPYRIRVRDNGEEVKDYSRCERYLGEKASHGCIRVQKEKTPEGVNVKWLWDNLSRKPYTKVIIWDDLDRELGYPGDSLPLYYNPKGGENYHSQPACSLVKDKYEPMTAFTYGELDSKPYSKLSPCPGCAPMPRKNKIDELNAKSRKR